MESSSEDDDDDLDEYLRPLTINLLLLSYLTAHTELSSIAVELEMLEHGMALASDAGGVTNQEVEEQRRENEREGARGRGREEEDQQTWRVENGGEGREGPLLSTDGKVSPGRSRRLRFRS